MRRIVIQESKILDLGSWIQDPGSRLQDPGSRSKVQDPPEAEDIVTKIGISRSPALQFSKCVPRLPSQRRLGRPKTTLRRSTCQKFAAHLLKDCHWWLLAVHGQSRCPEEAHLYLAPSTDWRSGLPWTGKRYRRMATNRCGTQRSSDKNVGKRLYGILDGTIQSGSSRHEELWALGVGKITASEKRILMTFVFDEAWKKLQEPEYKRMK